jgi:folate-binding protein YgfZ
MSLKSEVMPAELTGALRTILEQAAFARVDDQAFLRISGSDATRWLNGMVTNSIQALQPGEGNYNFLLNAQGRIQGDCTIYRDPDGTEPSYLLQTDLSQVQEIQQLLDKFIIMDDVELTRFDRTGVLLLGPNAPRVLSQLDNPALVEVPSGLVALRISYGRDASEQVTTPPPGLVPQFFITAEKASDGLAAMAIEARATEVTAASLEQWRVLEARPRYGTDIRDKDLPQETNQPHALHFAKGCYVGQEIVERIRSRGQVHRLFTPFRLEGDLPTTFPVPLEANGKPAGELTSATTLETTEGPVHLALGYARREALDTHAPLTYGSGTAHPRHAGKLR